MQIHNYFSYYSHYDIKTGTENDTFSLTILIGNVEIYELTINYAFMEEMPNIELVAINLTIDKVVNTFVSKKDLAFDSDVSVTAHLLGFSSSNVTR